MQGILTPELETWEAPEDMQKGYPYFLSGFDYENRPGGIYAHDTCVLVCSRSNAIMRVKLSLSVWVVEAGKWDVAKATEQGEERKAIFQKYCYQFAYRVVKSIGEKATEKRPCEKSGFYL